MSFGFGFALPAYPLRGGGGNNPFNQLGPTLDLSFTGVVTDLTDPNGYTLNTDFIIPQYQIAAQYVVWETGVGLVDKTFSQIITFTRASTATYFDSAGVLQSAAIDAPRLDYNPSTLAAQGFLIEEARTNSLPRSEEFSDASWTKGGATVTADSTTAPSGTATADTLVEDTSTGQHRVYRSVSGTTNTNPYTYSIFAKASTRTRVYVGIAEGTTFVRQGNAVFDLSAGIVVSAGGGSGGATGGSATIQNVGNGWYRCTYTLTLGGTDTTIFGDINLVSTGTTISYTGNGTAGLFIWGAQLEAGAFATSYIPTTTTALTRSADVASVNTLSPWYNATASTLYTEFNTPVPTTVTNSAVVAGYDDGTANNRFSNFYTSNTGAVNTIQVTGGATNYTISAVTGLALSNVQKQATRFQAGSYASSANGAAAVTDSFASAPPTVNTLRFGLRPSGTQANMWLRRVTVYPRGLTNLELQTITLPAGATITTQDYSFDSNFTGNTVAIGS